MKTVSVLAALSVALAFQAQAQSEDIVPFTAVSRWAHETVWQRVEWGGGARAGADQ